MTGAVIVLNNHIQKTLLTTGFPILLMHTLLKTKKNHSRLALDDAYFTLYLTSDR